MSARTLLSAIVIALGLAAPVAASTVILDTLNQRIGVNAASAPAFALINLGATRQNPLGQSFVTEQDFRDITVEAKFLSFGSDPASAGFSVDFLLLAGEGLAGAVLGSVSFVIPGAEVAGRTITSRIADFSALGVLAAGSYTAVVRGDGRTNAGALLSGSPRILQNGLSGPEILPAVKTPGSTSFGPTGPFNFGGNLGQEFGFRVTGTSVSPVPLPAAAWLLLTALVGLGVVTRRSA